MFGNVYNKKKVMVTGHAGFKGGWLSLWLKELGAEVVGFSLLPASEERLYDVLKLAEYTDAGMIADIRHEDALRAFFDAHRPDIVFHLAAQPLVRLSYAAPTETYETNVMGTLNVLEAARHTPSVKAVVNITTDKCYDNVEKREGYRENDAMGGHDMYSSSKACSEILTASYRRSFLEGGSPYALASARAGNVIGGGDWAKDRLIPDCIRAFQRGETVVIRNPHAIRPWQYVLEPLAGYLRLGQKLMEEGSRYACGYNFGPAESEVLAVRDVVQRVRDEWGCGEVRTEAAEGNLHEANILMLNTEKAHRELGVRSVYTTAQAINHTVQWYKTYYREKGDMRSFSLEQIRHFAETARSNGLEWSK